MAFRAIVNCSLEREVWNLRNNGLHCDVFLQGCEADAAEIRAHRVVLSARSPYFRAMFNSNMQESRQDHVQLHNISGATLRMLVEYTYTSEVSIDEGNVEPLLHAAVLFGLEPLAATCWNFLGLRIDPGHMLLFYCLAELYQCADLVKKAKNLVQRHFRAVVQCEEFLHLEKEQVMALTGLENIECEEIVLDAVFSWIRHDPAERSSMLTELLSMVRLAHVDPDHLHHSVVELIGHVRHCGADLSDQVYQSIEDALCVDSQPRDSCEFCHVLVGFGEKVMCIDPRSGVITVLADVPDGFQVHGSTVMDGSAYVLGTFTSIDQRIYHHPVLYRFQLDLGTWTRLAAPQSSHFHGGVVAVAGRVYAVGGRDDSLIAYSTVECYDPAANSWRLLAELPLPLCLFGFAVHHGCLFTFGGLGPPQTRITAGVNRYDPQTGVWTECLQMSGPRFDCSACLGQDGIIYVVGGKASEGDRHHYGYYDNLADYFDGYNPQTNQWVSRGNLPFPGHRLAVGAMDGYVYVVGASDRTSAECSANGIQAYDEITRTWSVRAACGSAFFESPKCAVVKFKKALLLNYPRVVADGETDDDEDG